jgi:hypothetical protein
MDALGTDQGDLRHSRERALVPGYFDFPQTHLIGHKSSIGLPVGCFPLVANGRS